MIAGPITATGATNPLLAELAGVKKRRAAGSRACYRREMPLRKVDGRYAHVGMKSRGRRARPVQLADAWRLPLRIISLDHRGDSGIWPLWEVLTAAGGSCWVPHWEDLPKARYPVLQRSRICKKWSIATRQGRGVRKSTYVQGWNAAGRPATLLPILVLEGKVDALRDEFGWGPDQNLRLRDAGSIIDNIGEICIGTLLVGNPARRQELWAPIDLGYPAMLDPDICEPRSQASTVYDYEKKMAGKILQDWYWITGIDSYM